MNKNTVAHGFAVLNALLAQAIAHYGLREGRNLEDTLQRLNHHDSTLEAVFHHAYDTVKEISKDKADRDRDRGPYIEAYNTMLEYQSERFGNTDMECLARAVVMTVDAVESPQAYPGLHMTQREDAKSDQTANRVTWLLDAAKTLGRVLS